MKFPNHILLDWRPLSRRIPSQYWFAKYAFSEDTKKSHIFFFNFIFKNKLNLKEKNLKLNSLLKDQTKYTIQYSKITPHSSLLKKNLNFYKNFFNENQKVKHKALKLNNLEKKISNYAVYDNKNYNQRTVLRFFKIFLNRSTPSLFLNKSLWNSFDMNFLRKERIYTKLKYSRVPQYDIVSGGSAALFAGFLGFLICEKFGFELLDSGDFYTLMMYVVFFSFFSKLFLKLFSPSASRWSSLSLKWIFLFYKTIFFLFFNFIKLFFKKK